jgi:hypothetical protein
MNDEFSLVCFAPAFLSYLAKFVDELIPIVSLTFPI